MNIAFHYTFLGMTLLRNFFWVSYLQRIITLKLALIYNKNSIIFFEGGNLNAIQ